MLEILLIYPIYVVVIIAGYYYADLFKSKDQYTRDELKSVLPFLPRYAGRLFQNYSPLFFLTILFISSLLGMLLPGVTYNWLVNSAAVFAGVFFLLPALKKYFADSRVAESEHLADSISSIFVKYTDVIVFGFGAGYASMMILNWASVKELNFLWLLLNLTIISILLGITAKRMNT